MDTHSIDVRDMECTLLQLYMKPGIWTQTQQGKGAESHSKRSTVPFNETHLLYVHYRVTQGRAQTQDRIKGIGEIGKEMFDSLKADAICTRGVSS